MPTLPLHTHPVPLSQRAMSTDDCLSWLAGHRCGRLGYMSGRGRRSVAVCYALRSDTVVLRVGDYNDIAQYAPDAQVRLEVDGFALDSNGVPEFDTVTVEGRATRARPEDAPVGPDCTVWPDGVATTVISIAIRSLYGTAERLPQAAAVIRPPSRSTTTDRTAHHRATAEPGHPKESCRVRL
jgi:hypothetical protein